MSMILQVEVCWSSDDKVKKWTKEQRDELRQSVMCFREIAEVPQIQRT